MAGNKRSCCNRFCCFSSSASDEEGQDHPASAGPGSLPSAIDNTTETLPGPPKRSEAPIPGSSDVVTPRKDEIEQHVDPNPDVSRTHQCDKAPLSESQNILRKSEGEDVNAHPNVPVATQCDEPSSSGSANLPVKSEGEHVDVKPNVSEAETLPGPSKRSEAPIPGSSNVVTPMEYEIEQHVDPSLDVSGSHQCDKTPVSQSQNTLRKSEGENVNAHPNVPGATQCDEPSSSGSSNLPVIPEGEHVDVNPNVSEAPSSSYSIGARKSDLIHTIKHIGQADDGKEMDVDLDKLVDHISKLLKLREEEMLRNKKASNHSNFRWPGGLKKLNDILSFGTGLKNFTELLEKGLDFASELKDVISGPVTTILKGIGQASVVTAGLLVVAYTLERVQDLSHNKDECWVLIKEMNQLASVVKRLNELNESRETLSVIEDATTLVVEGAITCCTQLGHSWWKSLLKGDQDKAVLSGITQRLQLMYPKISANIDILNSTRIERVLAASERVLAAMESNRNPLSRIYPDHAVGIDESIEEVVSRLEIESAKNAVMVILHGFGGMGKSTLADAVVSKGTVVSKLVGFKYSMVRMLADSKDSDIVNLQKEILMALGGTISEIKTHEAGQRELLERLKQVQAFIYIDNVCDREALRKLLPMDMTEAKKVRLLLTTLNEDVKDACPRPCTEPKIYPMQQIQPQAAKVILEREIKDGINERQFNDIIDACGGIPLMLTLAAPFIGRAPNKQEAYSKLQKNKWPSKAFGAMHCAFAYDALPHHCIQPFLDICSYFKGWAWETLEDIVGKDELEMLKSRALVTRTTNDVASVHDVILKLARQKSEELEGKEVRLAFTSASALRQSLEEKGAKGIKGIWLSENKDALQISAATLDLMSKSLRVLRLGDLANVEGKCSETFKELLFFEAKALQLPFHDVSKLETLRYLSYQPNDELKLSKMPSSLRHMEFDGTSLSQAFQMYPSDLQQLEHLRVLRLVNFSSLKNLPKKLGDQLKGLHELSLSNCRSITKLPDSISKLQSLRILEMDDCSGLTELPVDFGSLSSLRELHLDGCSSLLNLPPCVGNLTGLVKLNLSCCRRLESIPESIGNLTRLVELYLTGSYTLKSIPEGIGNLTDLVELNLSGCDKLKSIPEGIGNLTRLVELNLSYCDKLKSIPKGIGNLTSLVELNLDGCCQLKSIPKAIGELKLLRILGVSKCWTLTELPDGLCNLSFITHLSFESCQSLEKLPDGFGQLASLKAVYLPRCRSLQKLPERFGQLKNLEVLDLTGCDKLRELCNDFHCLSSLQNLDLNGCGNLKKLPLDFHCLTSLQRLVLSECSKLEGKSMDHVVKMNRLQVVHIEGSKQLVDRWAEIQRDGGGSWSFTVISGQDLSRVEKEKIEKSLLLELDGLLTNKRGEQFHLSHLPPNTIILVTWELGSIIEEMIDEMQIRVIYIGPDFDNFSTKVKDNIFVVDVPTTRATQMLEKVHLTLDLVPDTWRNKYLQIDTRTQVGDEYRPCWRFLTEAEMEEFVVSYCKKYLRLKQLQEERDEESSNIELLTELFAAGGDERTPVFQKNESSVQQDPTANSEVKATCGVDKLEGKTILLEMRPPHSLFYDIRLPSLKEMYLLEKERFNFEIISIPLVQQLEDVFDVYKQFSREVPWLVLQNPWTKITREVQYFLAKHCTGWEEGNECEKCYPTINLVIDPNGRITIYRPPISPGDMRDRGEVFQVFFNYLERQSYQVTWGVNAPPTTWEKIEEVRKNEWQQLKNMSTLEFLFNHLESVSVQVKSLMRQEKFICFFGGSVDDMTWFMRSAMEQFRDNIHFIHFIHQLRGFPLENTSKEYYHPLENTSEMEGTSLLNLSRHETVRFIMRLRHLEEEMNGMDQSDEQLCELKTILHSLLFKESFTLFDKLGKMVGALDGKEIYRIFQEPGARDKVQRLINSMLKEGGKEMHDEDSSLIKKMQTECAAAVAQQNVDVYFDALRDYISHLWGVQLYQFCKLNKEGKKRLPPRVTWPTSTGLCRLKSFLSEGQNEDWVKYVIFPYSEKDALNTVVKSLVKDIGEAEWAVAGLLAVADLLERFETVPSHRVRWLFFLEEMFRLAQYSKLFNQKAELWRRTKCGAIVFILQSCIICCSAIDPSKFAFSRYRPDDLSMIMLERDLRKECDTLRDLRESGSPANLACYTNGLDFWPESEGEGGPSSEYRRSASCPDLWLESEDEGGPSSEYERSASFPSAGSTVSTGEEKSDGTSSISSMYSLLAAQTVEGGRSESEDEGGPSSEYKRSASFP